LHKYPLTGGASCALNPHIYHYAKPHRNWNEKREISYLIGDSTNPRWAEAVSKAGADIAATVRAAMDVDFETALFISCLRNSNVTVHCVCTVNSWRQQSTTHPSEKSPLDAAMLGFGATTDTYARSILSASLTRLHHHLTSHL
jgi:hypothetical protein